MKPSRLRQELARAEAATLTLRAKELAAGWAAGSHRAERKGSGVEFAGHRAYTPGDDLRRLDRHALLRHGRLLVREFLSDTERSVHLVVDASTSMRYRSRRSEDGATKASLALLLGAALGFIALGGGDRIGVTTVTEEKVETLKPRSGREAFERVLHLLEGLDEKAEELPKVLAKPPEPVKWNDVFTTLGAVLPRGSLIFVLSDFLDTDEREHRSLAALATHRRALRVVQVLTDDEVEFPFDGSVRLRDPESGLEVETEAASVRPDYQAALASLTSSLERQVAGQGGLFMRLLTSDPPEVSLRALASGDALEGRPRR